MNDDSMKAAWKRADAAAEPLTRAAIEGLLRPVASRSFRALELGVWTYVGMLVVTVVLGLWNLPGYRGNPVMLAVESGLAAVSAVFAAFGIRILAGLRRLRRADLPLIESIERRLTIYDRWFGAWLVMASATPWLLTLGINTLIDNEQGSYRLNHRIEFAVVTGVMIGGTYLMLRVATNPNLSEMRAVLHDLRAEVLERTPGIEPLRRRSRIWTAVGFALVALGLIVTVWLWMRNA
jgi:hypothetical protein